MRARARRLWPALAAAALAPGCGGKAKVSEEKAPAHAARLAQIADEDVKQVRAGLPAGAKRLGERLFAGRDKVPPPADIRAAMDKARQAERDLLVAKSTFFAVTDPAGVVLASDREGEPLAGKSLFGAFPGLVGASGGYVEALGEMAELRSVREGADAQWVAAAAIAGEGGPRGYFATGWAWRLFARHLEEQIKTEVRYEPGAKATELPLLHAFVVVGERVYGSPTVPEVSRQAVEGLGLGAKVGAGAPPFRGQVEITGRPFGVGAARAPSLCERCLVVALRSEV
ncbi:MAG TPA: hypothetical protein VFS43_40280 [Polyangiaceae bacterium]|nr:hypothetical protein [Polyangiaceae bacterium]